MTAKSSIHIAPGHGGYFAHNSRETFSVSQVFFNELNEISRSKKEALRVYHKELESRSVEYRKRVKQDLQKNAVTHLSAIINLNVHHVLDDLNPIVKHLEEELDTKVFQITVHRDEGKLVNKESEKKLVSGEDFFANPKDGKLYYDRKFKESIDMNEWEFEKNYHAHIEMIGIDSEGYAIKRNRLHTYFLRNLQTFTANSLGMERGGYTPSYSREQVVEIRSNLKDRSKYENPKVYGIAFNKVARDLGYFIKKEKRFDTHDFKAKGKADNLRNDMLSKQKDISKQEIEGIKKRTNEFVKSMRQQIQRIRRVKNEHYIKLEQVSKYAEVQTEAMAENTIWDMKVEHDEYKQVQEEELTAKVNELQGDITIHDFIDKQRIAKINTQHTEIDNHIKSIKDKNFQIKVDSKTLQENKEKIKELESASLKYEIQYKEEIEFKDDEIFSLKQQIRKLEKDVFSEDWIHTNSNGNEHKFKNIDVVKQLEKKHTKLEEDIETLKTKNNTLATSIEQKETQIASYQTVIEEKEQEIAEMESDAQSASLEILKLKSQEPVIKEIPAKITFDDVKAYTIKYNGDRMTVEDMIKKKSEKIKELKSQNGRPTTTLDKKDSQIADLEEEKDELYDDMCCNETKSVLSICEAYVDDVPITWKERAEELEEKVNQLQKVIDGVKGLISKVFSAFGVGEDEPDGLEKIDKRLATMESLKNPKKEKLQPIKLNTALKMKF